MYSADFADAEPFRKKIVEVTNVLSNWIHFSFIKQEEVQKVIVKIQSNYDVISFVREFGFQFDSRGAFCIMLCSRLN